AAAAFAPGQHPRRTPAARRGQRRALPEDPAAPASGRAGRRRGPGMSAAPSPAAGDAHGPRNVRLLVAAQALGGAAAPIIISLGGIVGQTLASDPSLATLPVSLYNLGLALSTIPAALLMRRLGRRVAYA